MVNIKNFDSNLLKIDKKSYKNIAIYYIGYIYIKKDKCKINSVNPLYLLVHETYGFTEEKEGCKYLNISLTNGNSKVLKNIQKFGVKLKIKLNR